jgi:hypothetical protein
LRRWQQDMRVLRALPQIEAPVLERMLGLDRVDGTSLDAWLSERIQAVVGHDYLAYFCLTSITAKHSTDVPPDPLLVHAMSQGVRSGEIRRCAELSESNAPSSLPRMRRLPLTKDPVGVVALLQGHAFFQSHGVEGALLISAGLAKAHRTPSDALLYLGARFTEFPSGGINERSPLGASLLRIVQYIGEARHTAGRGEHAGLPVSDCRALNERYLCDRYANGAFGVKGLLAEALSEVCAAVSECGERAQALLAYQAAAYLYRISASDVHRRRADRIVREHNPAFVANGLDLDHLQRLRRLGLFATEEALWYQERSGRDP